MCVRLRLCRLRLCLCWRRPLSIPRLRRPKGARPLPAPGLYDYAKEWDGGRAHIHLRLDPGGEGLLMVNALQAAHLNPSAALLAWFALEGWTTDEAVAGLRQRYAVMPGQARHDYEHLRNTVEAFCQPDSACPVHDLELDILPPFDRSPSAPYRMDLALTYRCNANCAHCYNARERNYPELDTQAWMAILDRVRQVGIPHVCFTGGEATLRSDLPQLVAHAHNLGLVVGLLTNGRRLSDESLARALTLAGLDHVQITLESHRPDVHDHMVRAAGAWTQTVQGIRNVLDAGLHVMTNTTLLRDNAPMMLDTIDFLAELGVPTVGCNALIYSGKGADVGAGLREADLSELLANVRERTQANHQRLIWYSPTQYCHFDPVQMELGVKGCTAALYNLCIEPDGAVIPCQSYYEPIGDMLSDPWDSIWNHPLAIWLRERHYVPETCQACPVLRECGGGCPLTLPHQVPDSSLALAIPSPG